MTTLRLELPAPVTGRLAVLDEIKGLAIILVILYHAGGVLVWRNMVHGDVGVDMFVILSGLGLAFGSTATEAGPFFLRRFRRIYPTYWVVLTACIIANTHFLQHHYSASNIILHYLGIHGWFGDLYGMSINDSFWFITLIVTLYLLYWFLRPLFPFPDKLLLAGAALCLVPVYGFFFANQSGVFGHFALRLPGFFLGLLLGRLMRDGRLDLPIAGVLAGALLLFFYVPYTHGIVYGSVPAGFSILFGYAFLFRAWASGEVRGTLKFLGDRSLEIFLIHQPLIREYNYYLQGRWFNDAAPSAFSLIVGMVIGLTVTLILSAELHKLMKRLR